MTENKKVLVGMSGGVDSSVCVGLLRSMGYEVYGAFILFSPAHEASVPAARATAEQLGVPFRVIDAREPFREQVILPFCRDYCAGRTPNPCVRCNPGVKFAQLSRLADELGCAHLATGHYARVRQGSDGVYRIAMPQSTARDQSYMLYRLNQSILSRLVLPLGEYEKDNIRRMAREESLACADAPDSMEICFIPDGDYAAYIAALGLKGKAGHFIGPDGSDLGPHKGVDHYTVGQRKGLGLALGKPAFIREIDPNGNVVLDWGGKEFFSRVTLTDLAAPNGMPLPAGDYLAKIRSAAKPTPCHFDGVDTLTFPQPVRAPAPGQSAVLYRDECVFGGGIIAKCES